jgi:hypothetical protein
MKSAKNAQDKQKKQAYTWAACILVAVFLISIAIPFMAGGGKKQSGQYSEKYYDLARDMPFYGDAAEAALLTSAKYQDIAKADLINTLFSKESKEARQAEDAEEGTPAAPDDEYKEFQDQQEKSVQRQAAAERRVAGARARNSAAPRTSQNSLKAGNSVSGGAQGGGVSSTIWRGDDKKTGGPYYGSGSAGANKAGLQAALGRGRATGFSNAYEQSKAAANAKDIESAASGASKAFDDGKSSDNLGLDGEMEKELDGLGDIGIKDDQLTPNALNDLDKKLDDKKGEKDKDNEKDQCKSMLSSPACLGAEILGRVLNLGFSLAEQALTNAIGGGGNSGAKNFNKSSNWLRENAIKNEDGSYTPKPGVKESKVNKHASNVIGYDVNYDIRKVGKKDKDG